MPKIHHIAMYVTDLEKAKSFFEKYFGAKSGEKYHNRKTDFKSYFLNFEDNTRLEIMSRPDILNDKKIQNKTGYVHLAFSAGSKEAVNQLTKKISSDGYEVISGPRTTGDGYYESCIVGFEDNLIEITI